MPKSKAKTPNPMTPATIQLILDGWSNFSHRASREPKHPDFDVAAFRFQAGEKHRFPFIAYVPREQLAQFLDDLQHDPRMFTICYRSNSSRCHHIFGHFSPVFLLQK